MMRDEDFPAGEESVDDNEEEDEDVIVLSAAAAQLDMTTAIGKLKMRARIDSMTRAEYFARHETCIRAIDMELRTRLLLVRETKYASSIQRGQGYDPSGLDELAAAFDFD